MEMTIGKYCSAFENQRKIRKLEKEKEMVIQSLYIINKAGSLMYHHDFVDKPRLDENDYLRLGSAFHAFHVISSQLSPAPGLTSSGIQTIEASTFRLHSYQSLTGVKFFVTADVSDVGVDDVLAAVYEAYCDFALKNPFYELEQVIKQNAKFDAALISIVSKFRKASP